MAYFTFSTPFETHPPQLQGSVVLFRDKCGNLIVCEPEPTTTAAAAASRTPTIPSISKEIKTIDTAINTAALQKYTIFEGTDGNKYLSPSASWTRQPEPSCIQLIPPVESVVEDDDEDDTPPYKLDHMYARKPVKPGEELKRPIRRRSTKSSTGNEIIIQESMDDAIEIQTFQTVNFVGERSPSPMIIPLSNRSSISRPRILNVREVSNSTKLEVSLANSFVRNHLPIRSRQRKEPATHRMADSSMLNGYQEIQLGSYITIFNNNEKSTSFRHGRTYDQHQHGDNHSIDGNEELNSSSGSTNYVGEDSLAAESHDGSPICFHVSNDGVDQVAEVVTL